MEFIRFIKMLSPFPNWELGWNAVILILIIIVAFLGTKRYRETKSRQLRNSLPGIYTSLGLLGTFGAICTSLSGIADNHAVETINKVGKTVEEISSLTGDLDLKTIISDLIPAFSTSIYGLLCAIVSTIWARLDYAKEDKDLDDKLKFKNTEELLEYMGNSISSIKDLVSTNIEQNTKNNNDLKESIQAQSKIFSKFVDSFIQQMEDTFETMKVVIGERVNAFGEEQFKQSKVVLEGLTEKLNEETKGIISGLAESVKNMSDSLNEAVSSLKSETVDNIKEMNSAQQDTLKKLSDDSLTSMNSMFNMMKKYTSEQVEMQKESISKQDDFNNTLLSQMSQTISESMNKVITAIKEQCNILQVSIVRDIDLLNKSYEFIDNKSSDIISNYQQSVEAFKQAVQNSHDINDSFQKSVSVIDNALKSAEKTNKGVDDIIGIIESKETNIEAIVMRIEEMSKAITVLQRLEVSISKLSIK